jgi:hypothetical protein
MRASRLMLFFSGCFVLLQGVDFFLTWALLETGVRPDVYEANPVANTILARQGWGGLAGFKAMCTAVALGAGLLASIRRPAVGLRLLAVEVLVMAGVVGYSALLVQGGAPPERSAEISAMESHSNRLGGCITEMRRFDYSREMICRRVVEGKLTLAAGIERMGECIASYAPRLSRNQQLRLPDVRHPGQIAAYLYHYTSRLLDNDAAGRAAMSRIERDISRRFPTAPRIKAGPQTGGIIPKWSCRVAHQS